MRDLRALIISEDPELRETVRDLVEETRHITPTLVLSHYPDRLERGPQVRLSRPDVAFLVIDRMPVALDFIRELESAAPSASIIAVSRLQDPRALAELMRAGVRDFLATPVSHLKFQDAIQRLMEQTSRIVQSEPARDPLIAFLPARGGSGTSTLACHIARAVGMQEREQVLLADLDFCGGISRYLFQLAGACSLAEFADFGQVPDQQSWMRSISAAEHLHVLHGGKGSGSNALGPQCIGRVLGYAAQHYTAIVADLPVCVESYGAELLRRAQRIFLVTTTETPTIGMARERLDYLADMNLKDVTRVLLTLCPGATAPNTRELEQQLDAPIEGIFDFTEKRVRQSLGTGMLIDTRTTLGGQIERFAAGVTPLFHGALEVDRW